MSTPVCYLRWTSPKHIARDGLRLPLPLLFQSGGGFLGLAEFTSAVRTPALFDIVAIGQVDDVDGGDIFHVKSPSGFGFSFPFLDYIISDALENVNVLSKVVPT